MSDISPLDGLLINNNISEELTPFAPAMMDIQDEVAERVNIPRPEKPENTGYGFFPTGGQNMFGVESWDLPDKWVTGLGLLAGMVDPGGGGKKVVSKVASKLIDDELLLLGHLLRGGSNRTTPAGIDNTINFLNRVKGHSATSPEKKELASNLINTIKTGKPWTYGEGQIRLIKNIKANTHKRLQLDKTGNILREEIMINPWQSGAGRGYYLGLKQTPMIDVDLPIGPQAHLEKQMTHGWKTRGDFLRVFDRFLKSNRGKNKQFRLYETPGGYRLWDTSLRLRPPLRPVDYLQTGVPQRLGQDGSYTGNLSQGYFYSRLSPKPKRPGDYIARYDDTWGYGTPIQENLDEIIQYHDKPIDIINASLQKGNTSQLGGLFKLMENY
mgnify:CR=1 FL=1|tara:strand:- start:602 stop:1750 length:1149 start_codon:yes stop_codon:yes gene_type:complete